MFSIPLASNRVNKLIYHKNLEKYTIFVFVPLQSTVDFKLDYKVFAIKMHKLFLEKFQDIL